MNTDSLVHQNSGLMALIETCWGEAASRAARIVALQSTPLFDEAWYAETNPDISRDGLSPLEHYLDFGGAEGRSPHPLFDGAYYLRENADVREGGTNPLIHFLEDGAAERRRPNRLFDTGWYTDHYLIGDALYVNALEHYLSHPANETGPQTNWAAYAETHKVAGSGLSPLAHYLRFSTGTAEEQADPGAETSALPSFEQGLAPVLPAEADLDQSTMLILFEPDYYQEIYPDVRRSGMDPFEHYCRVGYMENRRPHRLFDIGYYLNQLPEAERRSCNVITHYIARGAEDGRNPNPLFDSRWYRDTYADALGPSGNPLVHFVSEGGRRTNPSPLFDGLAYLARYPDVADARTNPLIHYLQDGMREGRLGSFVADPDRPWSEAADADLLVMKRDTRPGKDTVLFVTHSPDGLLKGHLHGLVSAYRRLDLNVVLIIAADRRITGVPASLLDLCSSVYVRENKGFDFAAWAHALADDPTLLDSDLLILTNDSLLGPIGDNLDALLERVRSSSADIVGLTENVYYAQHIQSFFIALKRSCLSSYAFNRFFGEIVNLKTKNEVIFAYELTFANVMRAGGLKTDAIFSHPVLDFTGKDNNRTIFSWRELLDEGFPFVKASLLSGEHKDLFGDAIPRELQRRGFDLSLTAPSPGRWGACVWGDLRGPSPSSVPPKIAFLGPFNVGNGLGVASRGYVKALRHLDASCNFHPIKPPFHIHAKVAPDWDVRSFSGRADVALVHLNGDGWASLLSAEQRRAIRQARFRVGLFVWETSIIPSTWLQAIDELDAIWAPSHYCKAILESCTGVPVEVVPHVVECEPPQSLPHGTASLCGDLGLDPQRRHILYAFDGSSFLARKNPHALIRAFRQSGLGSRGWQLVLKTKHIFDVPTEGRGLMDEVGSGGDVVLIDRSMSKRELDGLFAICPIYASSHASEGFGLTIAEAMAHGKVVVATDYGGSRDFLDASCGFPVEADEVPLAEGVGPYPRGSRWGRVKVDALARALTEAAEAVESGRALAIGEAAQARITSRLSPHAVASGMTSCLRKLEAAQGGAQTWRR